MFAKGTPIKYEHRVLSGYSYGVIEELVPRHGATYALVHWVEEDFVDPFAFSTHRMTEISWDEYNHQKELVDNRLCR